MAEHDAIFEARWHISTYSGDENCVEVAILTKTAYVRNSRNKAGARLAFPLTSWTDFLDSAIRPES